MIVIAYLHLVKEFAPYLKPTFHTSFHINKTKIRNYDICKFKSKRQVCFIIKYISTNWFSKDWFIKATLLQIKTIKLYYQSYELTVLLVWYGIGVWHSTLCTHTHTHRWFWLLPHIKAFTLRPTIDRRNQSLMHCGQFGYQIINHACLHYFVSHCFSRSCTNGYQIRQLVLQLNQNIVVLSNLGILLSLKN